MMLNRSITEVLIGAVVVVTAIWFLYYANSKVNFATDEDTYDLSADFRSVEGVTIGTDVRLAGVKIGIVKALNLNSETYRVNAVFSVKNSIKIANKLIKGHGRILVRKSGTEPKIRVMGESENRKLLEKCLNIILTKLK